jgi:hypothetical protein
MYAVVFHAHQKLDKVAHRHLKQLAPGGFFPDIKQIVHFEGGNGPDGAKLKRQIDVEQPWHFIDPHNDKDTKLEKQIQYHYAQLVANLKMKDEVRSAFEAAWLAHALVDGLTPAHHYPYEEELELLRGEDRNTRKGIVGRAFVKGDTVRQSMSKSLKLVGPKGLITNHALFEAGAYAIIAPLKLKNAMPSPDDIAKVQEIGIITEFKILVRDIAGFKIYDRFCRTGWTRGLSQDIKQQLAPRMAKIITLAWYSAYQEAAQASL